MFRYIGNKSKLIDNIINKTRDIIGSEGVVADVMAGTGRVALEYRRNGYKVIASDIMTYSKFHLISQLLINKSPAFEGLTQVPMTCGCRYHDVINYLNNLLPICGYFYNEFSPEGEPCNGTGSRKYFTSENSKKIDAIRQEINTWVNNRLITENEEALIKHTLIMAVNKIANISGTYGYYLSDFKKNSLCELEMTPFKFEEDANVNNIVLQGAAEDIAQKITADLCYIDPPYTKRQYAANYHILETLARGDFPEAVGKSGLRDWWDQHSKFCTKTKIKQSFSRLVSSMNCNHFLISYSEDGLLTIEQMCELFEPYGKVVVNEIEYTRFKSNQSLLPKNIKEYMIEIHK